MPTKRDTLEVKKLELEVAKAELEVAKLTDDVRLRDVSDYKHRRYVFGSVVSGTSVDHCMRVVTEWVRHDPNAPIEIVFNSPGGDVFDGFALFDFLALVRSEGTHVTTRCVGYAASMAGVLMQAGDLRLISPNSYLMIHEVSTQTWGKTSELRDEVDLCRELQERCYTALAERSTLTKKQIMNRADRKDWWLNADESLKHGFVDEIQ